MTHDVGVQVKGYLAVFGTLLVLTLVTVGISYLHLPEGPAVVIGLSIAVVKAALVAMFFMHLKGERRMVYWPLGLTAFLFVALLVSLLWNESDRLFGTRLDDAFSQGAQ
jgi:caa(3)-type oxidase subunit IV